MPAADITPADRKPSPRTPYAVRTPTARAKLTNGTRGMVLPGIDQRSAIARRYRDVMCAIIADLGGESRLSEARLQLIRRFSALVVQAETMEAALVDEAASAGSVAISRPQNGSGDTGRYSRFFGLSTPFASPPCGK